MGYQSMKYKYKIHYYEKYPNGWPNEECEQDCINRLAKNGWRLVSVNKTPYRQTLFYLEKEIED